MWWCKLDCTVEMIGWRICSRILYDNGLVLQESYCVLERWKKFWKQKSFENRIQTCLYKQRSSVANYCQLLPYIVLSFVYWFIIFVVYISISRRTRVSSSASYLNRPHLINISVILNVIALIPILTVVSLAQKTRHSDKFFLIPLRYFRTRAVIFFSHPHQHNIQPYEISNPVYLVSRFTIFHYLTYIVLSYTLSSHH